MHPGRGDGEARDDVIGSRTTAWRPGRKYFAPADSPGELHCSEQSENRADGDRESGESLEEEGVGEENEIYELRQRGFTESEAWAYHEPQIAHHQRDRDY